MNRFPFLDWMRGLAVVIMIQCHVFNSLTRMDLREGGLYIYSQFIGGMAAPLFLFMAGMTFAFQMESLERKQPLAAQRWLTSFRRASYILLIAFLFRFTNWAGAYPYGDWHELTRVDILNCMGVGMMVFSAAALFRGRDRVYVALAAAVAIAAFAPVIANLPWSGAPALLKEYIAPGSGRGRFAFFPCASYIGFGMTAGSLVRRTESDRMDRLMQWGVLIGFGLVFTSQYFANVGYTVYEKTNFWTDNPTLIFIRVGVALLMLAGAYLWTTYCVGAGWSWMQCLGKNSLQVYWVHVMLVYGGWVRPIKRALTPWQAGIATVIVTGMMLLLSVLWLRYKDRRAASPDAASSRLPKRWRAPWQPRRELG